MRSNLSLPRFICFILTFGLLSCSRGPVYQNTLYGPPQTPGGRMCVDQCSKARDYCAQSCILDFRACTNDMQADAEAHYDQYVRDQFLANRMTELLPSDFEHPQACMSEKTHCLSDCDKPYNQCYTSCGGTISVTTSCQFFCFE